jgi:hypothetical protein
MRITLFNQHALDHIQRGFNDLAQMSLLHSMNKRFGRVKKGNFYLYHPMVAKGDSITIVHGGRSPLPLRPREGGTWEFIGKS